MGRSDGAVHGQGKDAAELGDVSQVPASGIAGVVGAGRGGPEATSVGRAGGWAETVADHRGIHLFPGIYSANLRQQR